MYIGWPNNVNTKVLDSCSITFGEDATTEDSLENGKKLTHLKNSLAADKYSVSMDFDWVEKDSDGLTEKDRFYNWLKYRHCFGENPFQFPKIIVGSEQADGNYAFYKINGSPSGSKQGNCFRVQMTFEEVFAGAITIPAASTVINSVEQVTDKELAVKFSGTPDTIPVTTDFTMTIDGSDYDITGCLFVWDNNEMRINKSTYFANDTDSHLIKLTYKSKVVQCYYKRS